MRKKSRVWGVLAAVLLGLGAVSLVFASHGRGRGNNPNAQLIFYRGFCIAIVPGISTAYDRTGGEDGGLVHGYTRTFAGNHSFLEPDGC